jgi:hypothetical protein
MTRFVVTAARKWASVRLQTLYRTIEGMMKNRTALKLLLRAEIPDMSDAELDQIVDAKFCMLCAMQRYHVMTEES